LTAPVRRNAAAAVFDHWNTAAEFRREWLEVALSTQLPTAKPRRKP
jgi:hypothetical protein